MPRNNSLTPVKLPMVQRFGEKPTTEFKNNLDSIKVTLMQAPSMDDLRKYLPAFANATWSELPNDYDDLPDIEKDKYIREVFLGKTLPTALEDTPTLIPSNNMFATKSPLVEHTPYFL